MLVLAAAVASAGYIIAGGKSGVCNTSFAMVF